MSEQIGPSMSTEPGWMAASARARYYLRAQPAVAAINPSMLLSFERPAPAGVREEAPHIGATTQRAEPGRRSCLSTVLENCTEATISRHR